MPLIDEQIDQDATCARRWICSPAGHRAWSMSFGPPPGFGLSFWDGTVVRVDHVTQDQTNCSWNHKRHGVIEQILADYHGRPRWAPAALPGSIHGLTAARRHGVIHLLVDADPAPGLRHRHAGWLGPAFYLAGQSGSRPLYATTRSTSGASSGTGTGGSKMPLRASRLSGGYKPVMAARQASSVAGSCW